MPGAIAGANPTTVMPYTLATAFQQSREWLTDQNSYLNGEVQSKSLPDDTSRRSWSVARLMTPAQVVLLHTFYLARKGETVEFYFYDVFETDPLFSYDPSGSASTGRYTVRFSGPLTEGMKVGLTSATLKLVQVA